MKTTRKRSPAEFFANAQVGKSRVRYQYRDALVLWLRWNEAYELATAQMFSPGQRVDTIEAFMDKMDQLRRKAVSVSQALLD